VPKKQEAKMDLKEKWEEFLRRWKTEPPTSWPERRQEIISAAHREQIMARQKYADETTAREMDMAQRQKAARVKFSAETDMRHQEMLRKIAEAKKAHETDEGIGLAAKKFWREAVAEHYKGEVKVEFVDGKFSILSNQVVFDDGVPITEQGAS
jgi:rubrerythrin